MTVEDIPFVIEITERESWDYSEDDIRVMMELEPRGCFVVEIDDERVGMLTTVSYGRIAWIGNVVVRSDKRGLHLGTKLIKHAVSYLKKEGVEIIGGYSYLDAFSFYERIGFRHSFRVGKYSGMTFTSPHRGSKTIQNKDLGEIVEVDKKYYPGDRADILGISASSQPDFFLWAGNGGVQGYITGFSSPKACEIGPWICDPARPDLAEDLLLDCFSALGEKKTSLVVPTENKKAIQIVEEHGLTKDFEVIGMFYETDESKMDRRGIFAAGSLEMG
jgi:ribosomal protein S18 acetylase RimI-like enzyme